MEGGILHMMNLKMLCIILTILEVKIQKTTQLLNYRSRDIPAGVGSVQEGNIDPARLALYMDETAVPVRANL